MLIPFTDFQELGQVSQPKSQQDINSMDGDEDMNNPKRGSFNK